MYFVISNSLNVSHACQFFIKNGVIEFYFEDLLCGDSKMVAVIIEGLELLLKYVNKAKKVLPVLNGKLKYMKE